MAKNNFGHLLFFIACSSFAGASTSAPGKTEINQIAESNDGMTWNVVVNSIKKEGNFANADLVVDKIKNRSEKMSIVNIDMNCTNGEYAFGSAMLFDENMKRLANDAADKSPRKLKAEAGVFGLLFEYLCGKAALKSLNLPAK